MQRFWVTLALICGLAASGAAPASAQGAEDLLDAFARALGSALEERQQSTPDEPAAGTVIYGEYSLTSDGSGPRARTDCTITLSDTARFGHLALERNFACQQAFNEFFHVNQWRLAGHDIVFVATGGREMAVFRPVSAGRYIADRDGVRYWLTAAAMPQQAERARDRPVRRRADPRPAFPEPTIESLSGNWRLGEAHGARECELRLQNRSSLGDYQLMTAGGNCPRLAREFLRWNLRGDELVFVGARERIVFRMRQTASRRWDGEMGGEALYIAR